MKNLNNKKKIILGSILGILLGSVGLVSYAMYTYTSTSTTNQLVVGDIYMRYKESSNTINFTNAMPSNRNNKRPKRRERK